MTILAPALIFSALASKEFDLARERAADAGQRRRGAGLGPARVAGRALAAASTTARSCRRRCSTTAATWACRSPCSRSGRPDSRRWWRCSRSPTCCISRSASRIIDHHARFWQPPAQPDGVGDVRSASRSRITHPPMPEWAYCRHQDGRRRADPDDAALARRAPVRSALGRLAHRRDRRHRVPGDRHRDGARCWRRCSACPTCSAACSSSSARCRRRCSTSWSPSSSRQEPAKVASIVLIGNVLSVVFVPLGLALAHHAAMKQTSTSSCSTSAACSSSSPASSRCSRGRPALPRTTSCGGAGSTRARCAGSRPARIGRDDFALAVIDEFGVPRRRRRVPAPRSRGGRAACFRARSSSCSRCVRTIGWRACPTPTRSTGTASRNTWKLDAAFHHNFPSLSRGQAQAGRRVLRARAGRARRRAGARALHRRQRDQRRGRRAARHAHAARRSASTARGRRSSTLDCSESMNLHRMLMERAAQQRPLRVALIGAGKFGSMYLAQAKHTPGIHVVAVADLDPDRARERRWRASAGTRSATPRARSPTRRGTARRSSPTTRRASSPRPRWRSSSTRRDIRPPASATRSRAARTASTS